MAIFLLSDSDVFLTLSLILGGGNSPSLMGPYRSVHRLFFFVFGGARFLPFRCNLLVNHLLHLLAHCLSDTARLLLLFLGLLRTADSALSELCVILADHSSQVLLAPGDLPLRNGPFRLLVLLRHEFIYSQGTQRGQNKSSYSRRIYLQRSVGSSRRFTSYSVCDRSV